MWLKRLRVATFPETLNLDDVLTRLRALEGTGLEGARPVKRAAPSDDFEEPWAGFLLYAPTVLPEVLYACCVHCGNAFATYNSLAPCGLRASACAPIAR